MPNPRRYFTPEEANALLPIVEAIVTDARDRFARYQRLALAIEGGEVPKDTRTTAIRHAARLRDDIRASIQKLNELGVELKGLDSGLVDFPAMRSGQEVCLCWKEGEAEIAFWHDAQSGFAGRQPLAGEEPWVWEWVN